VITKQRVTSKSIAYINELWRNYPRFQKLLDEINSGSKSISVSGLSGSSTSFLIKNLSEVTDRPVLIVTSSAENANDLYDDLVSLNGDHKVCHFPSRQILPYDFKAPVGEIMGRRISTLASIKDNQAEIVITPIRAFLEPTITVDDFNSSRLRLVKGEEIDLDKLVNKLIKLGFVRVSNVEEVGNFALRGGLIDFFSPGDETPVRIELFGDEIETIRRFDVTSQRTVEQISSVSLLPKREILVTDDSLERYLKNIDNEDAEYIRSRYLNDPELPGLEWLATLFGIKQGSLLDYFDNKTIVVLEGEGRLKTESKEINTEALILFERLKKRMNKLPRPEKYYHQIEELLCILDSFTKIDILPFKGGKSKIIDFDCRPHPSFGSRLDLLGNTIVEFRNSKISFFITTDTGGQKNRLGDLIADKSNLDEAPDINVLDLKGGFVCPRGQFAILTDHQIFSRYHRRLRKKKFKEGVAVSDYSSLTRGDYVVHTDYGVARYLGLETLIVDNRHRDCLLLRYEGDDKLYVPIEEFNRVSKYSGKDSTPSLTRLGGPQWDKLKEKTKKAVESMAADLIKLYADRKIAPGYAFGEDTVWLKQLEASFIYDETVDQIKAINEVKSDMTVETAMDRLICGDVGFGKTEVAVRAAFKAIEKGTQVAVLVPTTILAQQHFITFKERLDEFPVKVEMLSRFRTKKEQDKIVEEIAKGKVDLVIGTHRLLSKDIFFKELGLLIVDEEHRFGVRNKEKLRQLKTNVDTLSMTATPIPRTLQMSLMGVRDMSLIATSPKDRLPIITEIAEFDPVVIATVILREIDRGGQVFFVHNRVQTIDAMYQYLKKIVPQAEIAVAHGQIHEKSLEGIMLGFMSKRFDVLLCTSIIESGLDIPSANTIIINRADRFGLAQLYQLRGRVGRSSRRAYAYLLTPPTRLLQADAIKRLRAIEAHSDLGSGFALAMRDLEIRGAGTVLGARQSGFIEEIGFDLYNKLLEEAIAEQQGKTIIKPPETKLETDIEMYLDSSFINDRQHKVEIYRRLADSTSVDTITSIREEVTDRFGKLPQSATNLFDGTLVKVLASNIDIEKVKVKQGMVNLFFKEDRMLKRSEVESIRKATESPLEFSLTGSVQIIIDMIEIDEIKRLSELSTILESI
jgi:transcription-repair coupling factor (superfamily II helicase)